MSREGLEFQVGDSVLIVEKVHEGELGTVIAIADVTGKHGAFEFVMGEPGQCPNCRRELTEKSLVEAKGGIEIEPPVRATR